MRALFFVFSLHLGPEHPGGDSWLSADKAKHFFTSALVESLAFGGLRSTGVSRHDALIGAAAVSSAVGIGKEAHDRATGGLFSVKDLTWDGLGIGAMSLLLRRTSP